MTTRIPTVRGHFDPVIYGWLTDFHNAAEDYYKNDYPDEEDGSGGSGKTFLSCT